MDNVSKDEFLRARRKAADHAGDTSNPHSVTKAQVGLGNVTNDKQLPLSGGTVGGNLKIAGAFIIPAATRPTAAMTANNAPSPYVASASSEYSSSYQAWRAFNKSYGDDLGWASSSTDANPWIMLKLDKPLYDIVVTMRNRTRTVSVNGPIAGAVYGSNDGVNFTPLPIGEFSGRDGVTSAGGAMPYACSNSETAYQYVKISITDWFIDPVGGTYVSVGEIYIDGKGRIYA